MLSIDNNPRTRTYHFSRTLGYDYEASGDILEDEVQKTKTKTKTIRTYFPETWIWDLVSVG